MDKKKGIIFLQDLERNEVEVDLGVEFRADNPWVDVALRAAAPQELETSAEDWAQNTHLEGSMKVEKLGAEYMLSGRLEAKVEALCSRCAEGFPAKRETELRIFFEAPEKAKFNQSLNDGGDPDYIILESDKIELAPILTEQLLVQVPVAECPERGEDGTCSFCGKNPQFAGQGSEKSEDSSPFSKLKDLAGRL